MTARRHDPSAESAIREAAPPSKPDPWPTRLPLRGPLFDSRYRRHVEHLSNLGPKPIGEFLLQLVGTQDDARTALVVLLERYRQLDADVVQAVGGDRWPETVFQVGPT
jgi:hypothetical protein